MIDFRSNVNVARNLTQASLAPKSGAEGLSPLLRVIFVAFTAALFAIWLASSH